MAATPSAPTIRTLYAPRIPADLIGLVRVEPFERHAFLWCTQCPVCADAYPRYEVSDWAAMRYHIQQIHGGRL